MREVNEAERTHSRGLVVALDDFGKHLRALIVEELRGQLPELEAVEADAYARVNTLWAALRDPETALKDLDGDIARLEVSRDSWLVRAGSPVLDVRAEASVYVAQIDRDLERLRADRDALEDELNATREALAAAQDAAQEATSRRLAAELNLAVPLFAEGLNTLAFRVWYLETGHFVPVLLAGDPEHVLWDAAIEFLDTVCLRSGYRTGHLSPDAERIRKAILADRSESDFPQTVEDYANSRLVPDVAPSAAEIMADTKAAFESVKPNRDVVEDYRVRPLHIPMRQ